MLILLDRVFSRSLHACAPHHYYYHSTRECCTAVAKGAFKPRPGNGLRQKSLAFRRLRYAEDSVRTVDTSLHKCPGFPTLEFPWLSARQQCRSALTSSCPLGKSRAPVYLRLKVKFDCISICSTARSRAAI